MTEWLVDGLIPRGHTVALLGQIHSGKAWLAEQLAICVASGDKFLDTFVVHQQPVILIDEDSGTGSFKRRFCRLERGLGVNLEVVPLKCYSRCGFLLWDVDRRRWLGDLIRQQKGKPLVIIDSLEKVMAGQDLGVAESATRVGEFCRELRDSGATLVIVHEVGARRKVSIEDWDITQPAPGFTMLIEGFDMALCMFRTPTVRTEFVVKPLGREVKLKVHRPFSIVLQEDSEGTWAKLAVVEELPELTGRVA